MPTFPQHPDAADYTSTPWTHPDTGIQWTSTLVATGTYRWQEYIAPAETGGGASAWADLTDKVTAPITTDNTALAAALTGKLSTSGTAADVNPAGTSIAAALAGKAPSTGIAPSAITGTAVTLSGAQTITGLKKVSGITFANGDEAVPATLLPAVGTTGISMDYVYLPAGTGTLALTDHEEGKVNLANSVTGTLPIANGGTNATTAAAAAAVIVNGNPINPSTIGATTPGTGAFTTLSASGAVTGARFIEGVTALGTVVTSATISITGGSVVTAQLTASTACTFTMPTATVGTSFVLHLYQAATTGNGSAIFTGVKWPNNTAPTQSVTAGRKHIYSFHAENGVWWGQQSDAYTP